MNQLELRQHRQILALAGGAFIVVFLIWQFAADSQILYPFRLMVTFVHEAGHGLSALVTGGHFLSFEVMPNGAGLALTAGGDRFIILTMGYLGAALFGAVLLYSTNRVAQVRLVALGTGVFFLGVALLFAQQGRTTLIIGTVITALLWLISERTRNRSLRDARLLQLAGIGVLGATLVLIGQNVALVTGLIAGMGIMLLGALAPRTVTIFVLNVFALITGLNAVNDILSLWNNQTGQLGNVRNDAWALAEYTHLPVQLWILVWIGVALLMMGLAAYFAFIRPTRSKRTHIEEMI